MTCIEFISDQLQNAQAEKERLFASARETNQKERDDARMRKERRHIGVAHCLKAPAAHDLPQTFFDT